MRHKSTYARTSRPRQQTIVARTIATLFSASAMTAGVAQAVDAVSQDEALPAITVTAQRKLESAQDVPITLQAVTQDQLKALNITNFDDAVRFLPNVTFAASGPGQGTIFMRGLSAGGDGTQSSATIAPFPIVALYLDDESLQFPGHNLDIHLADVERIEVLEGPQGTLFGGGAEGGVVRYVTNKPRLDKVSGSAEVSYGVTAGGDPNSSATAVLNVPLITDKAAIRAVVYNDHRGGYITNVASTFTRRNTDPGVVAYLGGTVPAGSPVGNNFALAGSASNPVDTQGARVSALLNINDDWDVLIAQSFQNLDAQGSNAQFPVGSDGQVLGPDQATQFSPQWNKDHFSNTALTVNGKLGDLRAIYNGSYLSRDIDQQTDYTNYSRTAYGVYYTCSSPAGLGTSTSTPTCYSPITAWRDLVKGTHQSHEIRLVTPDNWRLRGTGGIFWEDQSILDVMNFNYKTIPSCDPTNLAAALSGGPVCVANLRTAPGSTATNPGIRGDTTGFGQDAQRGYRQTALYGSLDYDLIPNQLTLTAGTRYYRYSEYETGSQFATGTGCVNVANGQCAGGVVSIDNEHLNTSYHGLKSRFSLSWHIDPSSLAYVTFSQGFRPGAFNRRSYAGGEVWAGPGHQNPQYLRPTAYSPDSLTNYEIGYKADFLNRRVQLGASAYHMTWKDAQFQIFDPGIYKNTAFVTNGPTYTINGLEVQLAGKPTRQLTLQGTGSYNHSRVSSAPCVVDNFPGSANIGQCITTAKGNPFVNPYGSVGSTPAFSPKLQFSLRARYDWTLDHYNAYATFGANHTGSMQNEPSSYPADTGGVPASRLLRYEQAAYTLYDASVGIQDEKWSAHLDASNLFNSNASTFTSSSQFIKQEIPVRPRVIGVTLGYRF